MYRIWQKLLIAIFLLISVSGECQKLEVMTFNIRYANMGDSANAWVYRKDKTASQIIFHGVELLGVQEALKGQIDDLLERLPHFKFVGAGRADGKTKGEYSAILYDSTRLKVLETGNFWLAEKTDIPGMKGWDAAIERMVTWAKFKDKKTKKTFVHFNTHYDHMGQVARRESSKLLLNMIAKIAGSLPTIVTGDFNANPSDEPIRILVDSTNMNRIFDSRYFSKTSHFGPDGTFNAFKSKEISNQPIDYIFIKGKVQVLRHATLAESWDGLFSSDHFPVFATVRI